MTIASQLLERFMFFCLYIFFTGQGPDLETKSISVIINELILSFQYCARDHVGY